jgi:CIC family chloride channel protein
MSGALLLPSGEAVARPKGGGWRLWILAIVAGALVAAAVILLRNLIVLGEFMAFGAARGRLASHLTEIPWYRALLVPILGGVIVAVLLRIGVSLGWGPSPRTFGLGDVITNRRLRGPVSRTTLSLRDAFHSALITVVSLGYGASAGRECAAIHLGAALAILPGRLFGLDAAHRRMLLGMGVAAAVGAVLHAPLAGIFLARELVLQRQRLTTMGPVALAAVTAWALASAAYEGRPVIDVPETGMIPASFHLVLVVLAPLFAAIAWSTAWLWRESPAAIGAFAKRLHVPLWTLPVIGGVLLGLFALAFPPVMGVGYDPLAAGLGGYYNALLMLALALAKTAATAVTLGCRFGGGPIGPAIWVGAMTGSAFGVIAGLALGDASSAQVYFGVIGIAVGVAVLLEAPLAAGLLALELSGSPAIGAAAIAASFLAVELVRRLAPRLKDKQPIVAE